MPFTHRNIKKDLEDIGARFDGAPDLEFRAATKPLELEKAALSYQSVPPGYRFPYGHTHETQEEVYVVVRGSGRMNVDGEIVDSAASNDGRPAAVSVDDPNCWTSDRAEVVTRVSWVGTARTAEPYELRRDGSF